MSADHPPTTTKKELVNRIAERTGQTKVIVKEILQQFLDEIIEELARGHRLEFRDFGVFEVKARQPRQAQNPRTLEKVEVPARRVVRFKVGGKMRREVCQKPSPMETPRREGGSGSSQRSTTRPGEGTDQAEKPAQDRRSRPSSNSPF